MLDFSDSAGRKVDKHSTGGVGDKTSLVIAPIVAAGGLKVPMISGRGLGHSGGTLDKLESIPGFNVNLSLTEFRRVLATCGCALIGQTAEIAPADKKIYALRDVTGTVESPALICASIMSKKLAEGIDALVLDVKVGSGAFMKNMEDAAQPGGTAGGDRKAHGQESRRADHGHEPAARAQGRQRHGSGRVALKCWRGGGPADLRELCLELAAWMFFLGERVKTLDEGKKLAADLIASGQAREKFREIVRLQGGDVGVIDDPHRAGACAADLAGGQRRDGGYIVVNALRAIGRGVRGRWAAAGKRRKTRSIPRWAWNFTSASATPWSEASRCARCITTRKRAWPKRGIWRKLRYRVDPEKPKEIPPLIYRVIGAYNVSRSAAPVFSNSVGPSRRVFGLRILLITISTSHGCSRPC